MIKKKFITAGRPKHTLFEEIPNLGGNALMIVRHALHNHGDLMRRVALKDDVIEMHFFAAGAGALGDAALNHIARHAGFLRLFNRRMQPCIAFGIPAAHFGGDRNFLHQLADRLAFS